MEAEAAAKAAHDATVKQVRSLYGAITSKPPYCYGTVPLDEDDFLLYYGKDENARRINLSHATTEQLQHLADTCDPATFGVKGRDVYDEAYRKAGKLDARHFALTWSPASAALLDVVRDQLFFETMSRTFPPDQTTNIRAELYKLNVYGPQSFFKRHVDTPRDDTMFGSLVIVYPTTHEGGELVLRSYDEGPRRKKWTVDSSSLLSQTNTPSIAYAAFFSDVEHEVRPVQSGYRVMITYNLHFVPESVPTTQVAPQPQHIPSHENKFRKTFQALLDNPAFLPDGGNLLFCLWHHYPLPTPTEDTTLEESREALRAVADRLKGSDAMVMQVIRTLGLDVTLRIVVQDWAEDTGFPNYCVMCDHAVELKKTEFEADTLNEYLINQHNATLINRPFRRLEGWGPYSPPARPAVDPAANADSMRGDATNTSQERKMQVYWVTYYLLALGHGKAGPPEQTSYMAYGNEATIAHAYWKVSLLVRVGPFGQRATAAAGPQLQQR
ncbi:hypothetical protein FKP32DRAFT_1677805 [Trametes sanguinea]|nr:hypothetical protein FKP32DRAFT_1677805 [Trametes sanguinea]